jgi:hypothetical protein
MPAAGPLKGKSNAVAHTAVIDAKMNLIKTISKLFRILPLGSVLVNGQAAPCNSERIRITTIQKAPVGIAARNELEPRRSR